MCAGQPAIAVELVVIETKLADQLRMFRTATFQSGAHVENHEPIVPVSQIRQPILHIKIVKVTSGNFLAFFRANSTDNRTLGLPARDFLRILYACKIDHAHRPSGVIRQVNVMFVDECAVHATSNCRRVFGNQFRMCRIRSVIEDDTILPIRGALARNDENLSIRGRHDVIHQPRIDFYGVR